MVTCDFISKKKYLQNCIAFKDDFYCIRIKDSIKANVE